MIIYLSGKMAGLNDFGREFFLAKQKEYEDLGHLVINPGILPLGLRPDSYMPICLAMVEACDQVVMIGNWIHSAGANLEKDYAIYSHKAVYDDTTKSYIYKPKENDYEDS